MTYEKLDRPLAVDLPADVERAASGEGDGQEALLVRLQLPYRRGEGRVLGDLLDGGKPEVLRRLPVTVRK